MLDTLFQEKKIPNVLIFGGAGILLILVIITIILVFSGEKPEPVTEDIRLQDSNSSTDSHLQVMDFYLDDELQSLFQRQAYPMRDPLSVWDKQEVERYFIPVDEILHEHFQKMNDNYIKEIFRTVE